MKDEAKSKAELIEELKQMRRRVDDLEARINQMERPSPSSLHNRSERRDLRANIEFITDFDIVEARGINVSDGGISFELYEDLPFELRFELSNKLHHYRANLVWVKRLPEGGFRFGLMFVKPKNADKF